MDSYEYKNVKVMIEDDNVKLINIQSLTPDVAYKCDILVMSPHEALSLAHRLNEATSNFLFKSAFV